MLQILLPHIVIWAVLATVVIFLAIWRHKVFARSDEVLHVLDAEAPMVSDQQVVAKKLEKIDFWGKTLTVLVAMYALAIAGWYIYSSMMDTSIKTN